MYGVHQLHIAIKHPTECSHCRTDEILLNNAPDFMIFLCNNDISLAKSFKFIST